VLYFVDQLLFLGSSLNAMREVYNLKYYQQKLNDYMLMKDSPQTILIHIESIFEFGSNTLRHYNKRVIALIKGFIKSKSLAGIR